MYQERAQKFLEAGDGEAQLEYLQKWIRAAEMSEDQAALAQAHMQFGLAQQQQVQPCQQVCQDLLQHLAAATLIDPTHKQKS